MKRVIALLLVCIGMALPYLRSVEVLPTRADWSGWTRRAEPNHWVGNTFVANFDSLAEVALFTGSLGSGAYYELRVRDEETDDLVAHQYNVAPVGNHQWLRFHNIIPDGKRHIQARSATKRAAASSGVL
jgi:hypothetical protein